MTIAEGLGNLELFLKSIFMRTRSPKGTVGSAVKSVKEFTKMLDAKIAEAEKEAQIDEDYNEIVDELKKFKSFLQTRNQPSLTVDAIERYVEEDEFDEEGDYDEEDAGFGPDEIEQFAESYSAIWKK